MKNSSQLWAKVVMVGVTSYVSVQSPSFWLKINKNKNFQVDKSLGQIWNHFFEIFRTSFHYVVVITNSTITSTIISIYDHNNFPSIFAKYCARCHLMSRNYISQSLIKYKSCVSQTITHHKVTIVFFFFPQEHVPKVLDTLITTYLQRSCNSSSIENTTNLLKSKKQGP